MIIIFTLLTNQIAIISPLLTIRFIIFIIYYIHNRHNLLYSYKANGSQRIKGIESFF